MFCENLRTMRGRAEAARRAHNPEVGGSNPPPATKPKTSRTTVLLFLWPALANACIQTGLAIKKDGEAELVLVLVKPSQKGSRLKEVILPVQACLHSNKAGHKKIGKAELVFVLVKPPQWITTEGSNPPQIKAKRMT